MSEFKLVSEPFLDSDQAAAILRIHPKTLQRLARRTERWSWWRNARDFASAKSWVCSGVTSTLKITRFWFSAAQWVGG
jgi:hypothetical protein